MTVLPSPTLNGVSGKSYKKHPTYWFNDGSLTIRLHDHEYRVHLGLICRHSNLLRSGVESGTEVTLEYAMVESDDHKSGGVKSFTTNEPVSGADFEELLKYLYHDEPLIPGSVSPGRLASLLRVSSPNHLGIPTLHRLLLDEFSKTFPDGPLDSTVEPTLLYEGLTVATELGLHDIRKTILYRLVTTHHLDDEETQNGDGQNDAAAIPPPQITPADRALCTNLLHTIIAHFTPTLYTPAGGSHMACTDAFADTWMTLVIAPSYETDEVYKPMEALERMKTGIKWSDHGVCEECIEEKREEWTEEQDKIWGLLDVWIKEAEAKAKAA